MVAETNLLLSLPGNCVCISSSRGNSNCLGFKILAAFINSSNGVGFLLGSKARCMPTGSLERYFSVLLKSLQKEARLLLRFRKCRIFKGIDSKSPPADGVLGRELTIADADEVRSTELDFEEDGAVFKVIRQL